MPGYSADEAAPERVRRPRLTATPDPRLRPLISRGYAGFTEATTPRHLVLPTTTAVPLVVKLADSPHRPRAFVMGGHDTSIVLEGDCAPSYLEVLLSPLGAYRILGRPLDQLSGHTVDLAEVLGADGRRLAATGGAVPIGELAREVGWSHKHLIARFRQQVGLAPKTAARLLCFNAVWRHLDEGRPLDWGLVAAETGYADQAHLVREFRQFTGTTPTGFPAKVNSVQDATATAP